MDFNIDVRRKQLNSLDQFIKSSRENFESIFKVLNWSEDAVKKEDSMMIPCSINPEHKVPSNSLEAHIIKCTLRQNKYPDSTPLLSDPSHNKLTSIFLKKEQKIELFSNAVKNYKEFKTVWKIDDPDPKSADRLYCTYSPDERRVLYDHCVASTAGPEKPSDFNIYKVYKPSMGVLLTADEERARERDLKRRSFKYKKTYTSRDRDPVQVMRDVINGQMELYGEWIQARELHPNEPLTYADVECEDSGEKAVEPRKGPRTPEHEAPDDDNVYHNGNSHHDEIGDYDRKSSRHSSGSRTQKRNRTKSPRRRGSSRDIQQQSNRRRNSPQMRSRSRSPRGGSYRHHNSSYNRKGSDKGRRRERSREKRKYSSNSGHQDGGGRGRERSRSRSPRRTRR